MRAHRRLEKSVQTALLQRLRRIPRSWWEKVNDRSTIGKLDIYGAINGDAIIIEVKRKGERLKRLQYKKVLEYKIAGSFVFVVDELNADRLLFELKVFQETGLYNGLYQFRSVEERFLPMRRKTPLPSDRKRGLKGTS